MSADKQEQPWYALQIQSRFAKLASTMLTDRGYESFLPLYANRRQWSDRVKQIDVPLFPGYLFCRFDVQDRLLPILTVPGVLSIVGAGRTPIAIPEEEIEAIRKVVRSGLCASPWQELSVGSKVVIERGPLTGLEGVVLLVGNKYRMIVSVPLLQRSVAVEIDREWARAIASPPDSREHLRCAGVGASETHSHAVA